MQVICKRSGLSFEAQSARVKQHPQISAWLQEANKLGWYGECVEAIQHGAAKRLVAIEEFLPLIKIAKEIAESKASDRAAAWSERLRAIEGSRSHLKKLGLGH